MYASFIRRLAAGAVDLLLIGALAAAVIFAGPLLAERLPAAQTALLAISVVLAIVNGIFLPARFGWSAGDRLLGIRLVRLDRRASAPGIGALAAVIRFLTAIGVSPFFLLGFAWYFVDPMNRMWHDILAGTAVVSGQSADHGALVASSFGRRIAGLLLGAAGSAVVFLVAALAINLLLLPPDRSGAQQKGLPADFPPTIVVTAAERIVGISVTPHAERSTKEVRVIWQDVPADPRSIILAYQTGLELLGYRTAVAAADDGPRLDFASAERRIVGAITISPSVDGRRARRVQLEVEYPAK